MKGSINQLLAHGMESLERLEKHKENIPEVLHPFMDEVAQSYRTLLLDIAADYDAAAEAAQRRSERLKRRQAIQGGGEHDKPLQGRETGEGRHLRGDGEADAQDQG